MTKLIRDYNLQLIEQFLEQERIVILILLRFMVKSTATDTNNLGLVSKDDSPKVLLLEGGEILSGESFVADGEEIQLNDKRYGIEVEYNSDKKIL